MSEYKQMWHQGHWNAVAKEIRQAYPTTLDQWLSEDDITLVVRRTLERLAIAFANRFDRDNPNFNAMKWLDQCSPDPEMYPLSTLWGVE